MSDSIKVASMIVSMSVNVTEFERGMKRAADVAGSSVDKIATTGDKLKEKLASTWGDKGFMTGLKKFFEEDDLVGKVGAIGIGLGGWSLAIGSVVSVARELVGYFAEINKLAEEARKNELMGGRTSFDLQNDILNEQQQQNLAKTKASVDSLKSAFEELTKPVSEAAKVIGKDTEKTFQETLKSLAEEEKRLAELMNSVSERGNVQDQVMREMGRDPSATNRLGFKDGRLQLLQEQAFIPLEAMVKTEMELANRHVRLSAKIQEIQDKVQALNRLAPIRAGFIGVSGGVSGAMDFAQNGPGMSMAEVAAEAVTKFAAGLRTSKAIEQAAQSQDGIGGFIQKYFKAQQEFVKSDPLALFKSTNDQITKQLNDGVINEQQANILRGRARQGLDAAMPMAQPQFASLVRANTAEASRAILASMLPKVRPEDRPLKEIADESKKTNELLAEIGKNTARQLQPAGF
jgi:hypothetical protein